MAAPFRPLVIENHNRHLLNWSIMKTGRESDRSLALPLPASPFTQPKETRKWTRAVFELRTYTATPGKIDALHARFRDHTLNSSKNTT